jgi:hypothetical protein
MWRTSRWSKPDPSYNKNERADRRSWEAMKSFFAETLK